MTIFSPSSNTHAMSLLKIGITGENGFIGQHLKRTLQLTPEKFQVISFQKSFFENPAQLANWVGQCDVIYHLAAMNRHESQETLFQHNVSLVDSLVSALETTSHKPHILFSSSSQELDNNLYGNSKKIGREKLEAWGLKNQATVHGLIIPNVFGPFGKPFYNSFIATFCHLLANGQSPEVQVDKSVSLIYVQELVEQMIQLAISDTPSGKITIEPTYEIKVSDVLSKLQYFAEVYQKNGGIPSLATSFEVNLFNTFRSYLDLSTFFPKKLTPHADNRGAFVEIVRLGIGGQVSFSTTFPGITRGNHFHTRKIERFAVIKGKAEIALRRMDEDQIYRYTLTGDEPSFVDMPIWYTHNITNIGEEELYTLFWINEPFDPKNPDTYFVDVIGG